MPTWQDLLDKLTAALPEDWKKEVSIALHRRKVAQLRNKPHPTDDDRARIKQYEERIAAWTRS